MLLVDINFNIALEAQSLAALSDDERHTARRFRNHEDALRYAVARAALRYVVGEVLCVPPRSLHFIRDKLGRPSVINAPSIDFNVSHSGRYSLIAISTQHRVGVDIEQHRTDFHWRELATLVFGHNDAAYIARLTKDEQHKAFYAVWTAKEALLKALGAGISDDLSAFSVFSDLKAPHELIQQPSIQVHCPNLDVAQVSHFDAMWIRAAEGYAACIAWSNSNSN